MLEKVNKVNNDYREFKSAGYLLELEEFIALPEGDKAQIKKMALHLVKTIKAIEQNLQRVKLNSEFPVIKATPSGELNFFKDEVSPNLLKLEHLASDDPEIALSFKDLFAGGLGLSKSGVKNTQKPLDRYKRDLLSLVLEIYQQIPGDGDDDYYNDCYEITINPDSINLACLLEALVCIESKYFQPMQWLERCEQVKLLQSHRDIDKFPDRIRRRIAEAFDAYISGYNYACIATCRALLEYVLVDRAKSDTKWRFDPNGRNRNQKFKSLFKLSSEITKIEPSLKGDLEFIREQGNIVLHAQDEEEEFPPQSKIARGCLTSIFNIIETLYSEP